MKVLVAFDQEILSHMFLPQGGREMQMFAFYVGQEEFALEETLGRWEGARRCGQP